LVADQCLLSRAKRLTVDGRYTDFGWMSLGLNVRFGSEADIERNPRNVHDLNNNPGEYMLEERVDRRLAAIWAGDIAGYSRLMGVDEEGTLQQLKAHRKELVDPKITEHRGRIVKTTGDGMLVEFHSVVDAVRCAVDVQRGMAERMALASRAAELDDGDPWAHLALGYAFFMSRRGRCDPRISARHRP
jgi:class 3 adenylate cyclase